MSGSRERRENGGLAPQPLLPGMANDMKNARDGRTGVDPGSIYKLTENTMRLSRLEEERNLITALRHRVRKLHEGGSSMREEAASPFSLRRPRIVYI